MKIKEDTYLILVFLIIILILVACFGMYKYNEKRNEIVEYLENKGYVCQKDVFGFYKECLSPDYVNNYGLNFTMNLSAETGGQNG